MKNKETSNIGSKSYLEKSFLEELNYKIWSTKGARFVADKRLKSKSKMSNISLAIISAYLIIAGLISVYNIHNQDYDNIYGYIITALSIIVLVFSQFESAQDYKLNAKIFHDCGLELSELYNELRIFKTLKINVTEYDNYNFAISISEKYQSILRNYHNHASIDYNMFLINNVNYFKGILPEKFSKTNILKVKMNYYWDIYGWYSLMIIIPPIIIGFLIA